MRHFPATTAIALAMLWSIMSAGVLAQSAGKLDCPQPRFTGSAPAEYLSRTNPLASSAEELAAGQVLYANNARGAACTACHGARGDARGPMSSMFTPPPRNFACAKTVSDIADGQLFWIIRYGSPGTAMPPHPALGDDDIWRLVLHLRRMASN